MSDVRHQHDPEAPRGVPAHVTILHPFRPVVDETTADAVAAIARSVEPFEVTFTTTWRFPGAVVYLAPTPAARFSAITRTLVDTFPDCPPYGGAIPDPQPHLTVGSQLDEPTADYLEAALQAVLPLASRVDRLTLLLEDDQGQRTIGTSWPFGQEPQHAHRT